VSIGNPHLVLIRPQITVDYVSWPEAKLAAPEGLESIPPNAPTSVALNMPQTHKGVRWRRIISRVNRVGHEIDQLADALMACGRIGY
jgi:hypothetical protein